VVVGGDIDGTGVVSAGLVAVVLIQGVCQVLCDATTTSGDALVTSSDTAGAAQTSDSPTTRTIGLCLEAVTISSGTALVWASIDPGTQPLPASLPPSTDEDLTFTSDTVGPVLTDTDDGHTYRIISTDGTLSTVEVS
jgi:hypothetical protein